ncbi:MAG: NAD(P)/FAD-dependent oxidoreductase [Bacteroidetes bacterium]|nr:NAD(P)/FAD-dependent oxidoreductase [Bacteroidota bacterium]
MQITNSNKVSIIGGGLAGLTLAIQLADAGYSCVLFEKNKYPFHKVCGEYISMESWGFLERLGLNLTELNLPKITQLHVSSPSGKLLKHQLDLGGFGISRYLLDSKLAEIAKAKGVLLLDDCRVNDVKFENEKFTIDSTKGSFISDICVGAWGKKSNLDTKLSREFTKEEKSGKNYVGIKYHINIDFPNDLIELHNFENGYCGLSKIEGSRYCLCYLTDSENLKKHNGDIKSMEEAVLFKNPFLKGYFSKSKFLFEEPLAISQIKIGYKNAVENHILMLGDTAGNIAPLSGNGMSMAMRSSFYMNQLLVDYFNKKSTRAELEKNYQHFWKKQFKNRVVFSEFLQKLLKNTTMTNFAISVLKTFPFLRNMVVKSTHGKPF